MDNQNNKLYFPLFYKNATLLSGLTKEELGELIYAILISGGSSPPKEPLDPKLEIIFSLILEDAGRLFEKNHKPQAHSQQSYPTYKRQEEPKKEEAPKQRYGSFDPAEAFKKAIERTYGSSDGAEKFI